MHAVDGAIGAVVPSSGSEADGRSTSIVGVSMAEDDRFEAVKSELDSVLSSRIGEIMGLVRASRELVAQIGDADRQIQSDQQQSADARDRGDSSTADDLDANIMVLRALREGLVDRLASISASAR